MYDRAILDDAMGSDSGLINFLKTLRGKDLVWLERLNYASRRNEERLAPTRRPLVWRLTSREVKKLLYDAQSSEGNPDKWDCVVCGQSFARGDEEETLEHITPQSIVRFNSIVNHALTCEPCNRAKGKDYTILGARKVRKRQGISVDVDAADRALAEVRHMQVCIWLSEGIMRELDPYTERLHETVIRHPNQDAIVRAFGCTMHDDTLIGKPPIGFGGFGNPYTTTLMISMLDGTKPNFVKVDSMRGRGMFANGDVASRWEWFQYHRTMFNIDFWRLSDAIFMRNVKEDWRRLLNVLYTAIDVKTNEEATQCQTSPKAKTRARARASGSRTIPCRSRYQTRPKT